MLKMGWFYLLYPCPDLENGIILYSLLLYWCLPLCITQVVAYANVIFLCNCARSESSLDWSTCKISWPKNQMGLNHQVYHNVWSQWADQPQPYSPQSTSMNMKAHLLTGLAFLYWLMQGLDVEDITSTHLTCIQWIHGNKIKVTNIANFIQCQN